MRCVSLPALAVAGILVAGTAQAEPSAANGHMLFVKVGCYQCHGYQGQGGAAGPRIAPDPLPFDGLAALDDGDRALDGGREVARVGDGPFRVPAHALRELRVVDRWIVDRRSDVRAADAPVPAVAHALHVHYFLMIRTVIVHDCEQRDAVVSRGP